MRLPTIACCALAVLASTATSPVAEADGEVSILVLRENGAGSAATAQSYIDELMTHVARVNGWSGAKGSYQTKRAAAKSYIDTAKPHYGILSLGAFLAMRESMGLKVVGQVHAEGGGGAQYYVVSKNQTELADCKGKSLATNHGADVPFIDRVVSGGTFKLADFQVTATTRPVQTLKKVIAGEAECALVDDAQMAELQRLEGGSAVHTVWLSAPLPPLAVVAFGNAPADEAKTFKGKLSEVCKGDGATACAQAGLKALVESDDAPYAAVIKAYGK